MDTSHFIALFIFASYFALIASLFAVIWRSIPPQPQSATKSDKTASQVFIGLTMASFLHTWFYMFRYMAWSYDNYHQHATSASSFLVRVAYWLVDTALFEEAWVTVARGLFNWWWSESLCLYTVGAWTVFLYAESRRRSVPHVWAYMLLGQVVAISVASSLFFLHLTRIPISPKAAKAPRASPILWFSVLTSLATVAYSPFTDSKTFLPNLLLMHAVLLVPLLPVPFVSSSRFSTSIPTLYFTITFIATALRIWTSFLALNSLPVPDVTSFLWTAWESLHWHPAQSSIGWDVVWSSVAFLAWQHLGKGGVKSEGIIPRLAGIVSLGPAFAAPITLGDTFDEGFPPSVPTGKKD